MAQKKIIWITSIDGAVEDPRDSALPAHSRRKYRINGAYSHVDEFEDVVADTLIANGFAIALAGCDTNPKCTVKIRFPQ